MLRLACASSTRRTPRKDRSGGKAPGRVRKERQTWLKSSPYFVFSYANPDKTEWRFSLHRFDDPVKHERDRFGLVIGDYVHNLRSALDHLVWQLVTVANGITPTDKTRDSIAFPVVTTHPKDFWSRPLIQRGDLTLEQALMIEGFQPYRAIGLEKTTPLADLHALWNADKHRLVTPIKVTLAEEGPVFRPNADAGEILTKKWDTDVALEGDAEFAWVTIRPVGPEPQVDVTNLAVNVAFGEGGRLIGSLPILHRVVRDIIENCAHFFEQPSPDHPTAPSDE